MFNLNEKIAEWRRQMLAAGIKTPVPLNELENHLRDDVEQQISAGLSTQQAFEAAVQGIGQAAVLEREFDKVGATKQAQARVKRAILTLAGIPNHYLNPPMNTSHSNLEPAWATYLKAAAFLVPAVFLWAISVVFVMPKLKQICGEAGGLALPAIIRIMIGLAANGVLIAGAI